MRRGTRRSRLLALGDLRAGRAQRTSRWIGDVALDERHGVEVLGGCLAVVEDDRAVGDELGEEAIALVVQIRLVDEAEDLRRVAVPTQRIAL